MESCSNNSGSLYCQWELKRIAPFGLPASVALHFVKEITPIRHVMEKGITSMGRGLKCTIRLPSILSSRQHCSIVLKEDGSIFIIDHKSLNGTFLHSEQILSGREIALGDGDIIGVGSDPSMEALDGEYTPNSHYIFKITRKVLKKDEMASCPEKTTVPVLSDNLFSYNNNQSNGHIPRISSCSNSDKKNGQSSKKVEFIELMDSEGENIPTSIEHEKSTGISLAKLDNQNHTSTNIITIYDSAENKCTQDNEHTKSNSTDIPENNKEETSTKQGNSCVKGDIIEKESEDTFDTNCDIPDDVLMSIKEVDGSSLGKPDFSISTEKEERYEGISIPKGGCRNDVIVIDDDDNESSSFPCSQRAVIDKVGSHNVENNISTPKANNDNILEPEKTIEVSSSLGKPEDKEDGHAKTEDKNKTNEKETHLVQVQTKENVFSNNMSYYDDDDDDVIFIDEEIGDVDLPCSQLFDNNCAKEEVEIEKTDMEDCGLENDRNNDIECWPISDSDSEGDSEATSWYLRLSQSHEVKSEDVEEESREEQLSLQTVPEASNKKLDPSVEDLTIYHDLSREENDVAGNLKIQDGESEILLRKIPSGSKRKLSESSDETNVSSNSYLNNETLESTSSRTPYNISTMKRPSSPTTSEKSNDSSSSSTSSKRFRKNYNDDFDRELIKKATQICDIIPAEDIIKMPSIIGNQDRNVIENKIKPSKIIKPITLSKSKEGWSKCKKNNKTRYVILEKAEESAETHIVQDLALNNNRETLNHESLLDKKQQIPNVSTLGESIPDQKNEIAPEDSTKKSRTSAMVSTKINGEKELSKTKEKLSEIKNKINESQKKKNVEIIEAKSIKRRRKSSAPEYEHSNKEVKITENKPDQWLSNEKTSHVTKSLSKDDAKAYRKEKLKCLAMKKASDSKTQDKPKTFTAKTKTTSKSRNDMFLQDLVSSDNTTSEKSDKPTKQKEAPLSLYKIPRRTSSSENHAQVQEATPPVKELKQEKKPHNAAQLKPAVKTSSKPVMSKSKQPKPSSSETTKVFNIDQILNNGNNNFQHAPEVSKSHTKTSIGSAESSGEEPTKVIYLTEEDFCRMLKENNSQSSVKRKSIIKKSPKPKSKNRIKFNLPTDDRNVVYLTVRYYEVDEDSQFRPVTKSVSKETTGSIRKPCTRKDTRENALRKDTQLISYWEELIWTFCTWNCRWLDETIKIKTDPPVFSGQKYPLTLEFADFKDYRRGMYPLLMYEVWGSVARQYTQSNANKNNINPTYVVEIRETETKEVPQLFYPGHSRTLLQHVRCQVLLNKKQQSLWPRTGDLVVLSIIFLEAKKMDKENRPIVLKGGEKRIFGYISYVPPAKPITPHSDVSPNLRMQCPNANMFITGLDIIIKGDRGQSINKTQPAKFIVLKNIKPDLRAFEALDYLPKSPLCEQIYHPRMSIWNSRPLPADNSTVDISLNPSQKKAVLTVARACLEDGPMLHLIHGPPGCGKSQVIVNIVMQMWNGWLTSRNDPSQFPQILLCAPSNSAIDDLVNKLVRCRDTQHHDKGLPKFEVIRVGVPQSTHETCAHLTLDYLTKKEMKRLEEIKNCAEERKIEFQFLEAKMHQMNQKLETLKCRQKSKAIYNKQEDIMQQIADTEKKLAEVKQRIKFFENDKKPSEREMASKYKETQMDLLAKAKVIATTLSSCYNSVMAEAFAKRFIKFDCCIVDEATQCIEPDTLIPLLLGVRKLVLVGDPKQLPATVITSTAKSFGLEKSLFTRQYDWWRKQAETSSSENPCHFLNVQYRMHPEIARWPSEHFYEGRLHTPPWLKDRSDKCPLVPYVVLSHTHHQNTLEAECNSEESRMVALLVREISHHPKCEGLTIAVITPYNRQKDDLRRRINLHDYPNVQVGSVDSYQGRESDVVIFSCVRTEGVGFLGGAERLNVALTRAKLSCIVIGNFMSLQRESTWKSLLNDAKSRNLLNHITNVSSVGSLVFKQRM